MSLATRIKAVPGGVDHRTTDYRFYLGSAHLKLMAIDRPTGVQLEVAKLCPVTAPALDRELAMNFAALACAAPRALAVLEALAAESTNPVLKAEAQAVLAQATRQTPTDGLVSPIVAAAIEKGQGEQA